MNARILAIASLSLFAAAPITAAKSVPEDTRLLALVDAEEIVGEITSVDLENSSFELQVGERKTQVRIDQSTRYLLDDREVTREEVLKVGQQVTVTHEGRRAMEVRGRTERAL